ncbi:7861_t:CDS:2, partial [Dentiscutata erythropus]
IKGTKISDSLDIFHMEVTGPLCNATDKHTMDARLTLYALSILPDSRSELATAVILFSFNGRSQYKGVLNMMANFHSEITKQEEIMKEVNRFVLRPKDKT